MKIQSIKVSGFRNLKDSIIPLDDITALIGINNFGKSNVLLGLNFAFRFIKGSKEEKEFLLSSKNNMPLNQANRNEDFSFELEIQTTFQDKPVLVVYGFSAKWKFLKSDSLAITREYLRFREIDQTGPWAKIIERNISTAKFKKSQTGRCSNLMKVRDLDLVLNRLADLDPFYYKELTDKLNSLQIYTEDTIDAGSFYAPDIISFPDHSGLLEERNLPRILHEIEARENGQWDLLIDMVKILFPSIQNLIVKRIDLNGYDPKKIPDDIPLAFNDEIYALYVQDNNIGADPLPFSQMSNGMKRMLLILARMIIAAEQNVSLILLEEPENSIHPGLLNAFLQMVSDLVGDCKVLLTSHSPQLIEYLGLDHLLIGVSSNPGLAAFKKFSQQGQEKLLKECQTFDSPVGQEIFSLLEDSPEELEAYLSV